MATVRRLRDLQSQAGNKIYVDCSQKNSQWASVSYDFFKQLEERATAEPDPTMKLNLLRSGDCLLN